MPTKVELSDRLADEIREWAHDEHLYWPSDTAYQDDLMGLMRQLDATLPTAEDVRGILGAPDKEQ